MRSESEIQWVRVKNNVGQATRASDWHAIIPGEGDMVDPPGTVCGTALSGQRQMITHEGSKTIDGLKHAECMGLVEEWLAEVVNPSKGTAPFIVEPEPPTYAPPGSTDATPSRTLPSRQHGDLLRIE